MFNVATLLGSTDMDFLDGTLKLTNDTRAASVVGYFGIGRIVFCIMCIGLVAYRLYNPASPCLLSEACWEKKIACGCIF